jgi:hypothetical protein
LPLRVLVWNIQNFSAGVIKTAAMQRPDPGEMESEAFKALTRSRYIRSTVEQSDPAIFAVIELRSDTGDQGSLVSGNGESAALDLLRLLRSLDSRDKRPRENWWRLVPPLRLVNRISYEKKRKSQPAGIEGENNYTEGIAVYFRPDRVKFVGPYIWPPDARTSIPAGGESEEYPEPWAGAVGPSDVTWAGQWAFPTPGVSSDFPEGRGVHRRPWRTDFVELEGSQAGRTIQLVTVHMPPDEVMARQGTSSLLGYMKDLPLGPDEVMLLAGDFNVNTARYEIQNDFPGTSFRNLFPPPGIRQPARRGMYKNANKATPGDYMPLKALDGAFVRPATTPVQQAIRINRVDPGLPFTCEMMLNLQQIAGNVTTFRRYENFGHIGARPGTSDHMPILIEL